MELSVVLSVVSDTWYFICMVAWHCSKVLWDMDMVILVSILGQRSSRKRLYTARIPGSTAMYRMKLMPESSDVHVFFTVMYFLTYQASTTTMLW